MDIVWSIGLLQSQMQYRFTFQRIEDGNCLQETSDQWATDHLPTLLPPASDGIRHHFLQGLLLRSCSYSEPVHTISYYNTLCKVRDKEILYIMRYINILLVSWKSFLQHPMSAWWIYGWSSVSWSLLLRSDTEGSMHCTFAKL